MSVNLQETKDLLRDTDGLPDDTIWVLAVGMVAIAGRRATATKRFDINSACAKFVAEMAEIAGTPGFPPRRKKETP
jgi:hypothetical protein